MNEGEGGEKGGGLLGKMKGKWEGFKGRKSEVEPRIPPILPEASRLHQEGGEVREERTGFDVSSLSPDEIERTLSGADLEEEEFRDRELGWLSRAGMGEFEELTAQWSEEEWEAVGRGLGRNRELWGGLVEVGVGKLSQGGGEFGDLIDGGMEMLKLIPAPQREILLKSSGGMTIR